jgi:hypothetical protein
MRGKVTFAAGTPTLASGSYNITSITDTATGRLTVTIANDFSDTTWTALASLEADGSNGRFIAIENAAQAAGAVTIRVHQQDGTTLADPTAIHFAGLGDL